MSSELDESIFNFIENGIENVRCDYTDCNNLTNTIFKLSNMPKRLFGKVVPSYDVFVKLCSDHIQGIGSANLGEMHKFTFMDEATFNGKYYCTCQRCTHSFVPSSFTQELYDINREYFGRLVTRCPKCNQKNWKVARYRPVPSRAFVMGETARYGKRVITDKKLYKKGLRRIE